MYIIPYHIVETCLKPCVTCKPEQLDPKSGPRDPGFFNQLPPILVTSMDIILGVRINDAVLFATSKAVTRGISILKATDDKTRDLGDNTAMAFTGEAGDTVQFAEYVQANLKLYSIRQNYELSPKATASFIRKELATSLRSRKPYQVNLLVGGVDVSNDANKASLHYIDYIGTHAELPYAAHGYAAFYALSLLDRHYKEDLSVEEGIELLKKCNKELGTRMPIDFKGLRVKIITKDGIREIDDLESYVSRE